MNVLAQDDPAQLRWWYQRGNCAQLLPFQKLADSIQEHWTGLVASMGSTVNNGVIEALNRVIQLAKRTARGFRSFAKIPYHHSAQSREALSPPTSALTHLKQRRGRTSKAGAQICSAG